MTTRVISVNDGPRLTVSQMVKAPTVIPRRIISLTQNQFIGELILRPAQPNDSGVVVYEESTPVFADGDPSIVDEFGEIPIVTGRVGQQKAAMSVKRAFGLKISQEMVNRNNVDRVNTQVKQIKNTMKRAWDKAALAVIMGNPSVPTMNAGGHWINTYTGIRTDLATAAQTVGSQHTTDDADNYFGFEADTLVLPWSFQYSVFLNNDDINKVFVQSPLASENPQYKGVAPKQFFNFDVIYSREFESLYPGQALALERGTVGGISDERPLWSTPLYEEKRSAETWRSDTGRQSAMFCDQPKAAIIINNVA